ncbi:hypothetical protein Q7A53_09780 [Halobacillus rhizosphaerae]|uniref:hypothetical protein n=1 Tax=Halobacillus rhizosphaerae TaxID=3064889 RepID=UPI00398B0065
MKNYKKSMGWALFDVITLGIPLYIRHLFVNPIPTLKISTIVFPIILFILWLILP